MRGVQPSPCGACGGTGAEPGSYVRLPMGECDYETCRRCEGGGEEPCGVCQVPSSRLSSRGHCEACATEDDALVAEVMESPVVTEFSAPIETQHAVTLVCRLRWLLESRAEWLLFRAQRANLSVAKESQC